MRQLPEVDVKNNPTDKRSFEIHHKEGEYRNYPYTFTAHEDDVKPDWIREIQEHAKDPCKSRIYYIFNPTIGYLSK